MEKKKKGNLVLKVLGLLFLLFLSLTIAMETGYYEARLHKKTTITEEAMKRFEEDVRNGKEVDITNYVQDVTEDYSNSTTKAGVVFSNVMEEVMSKGIGELVLLFQKLFT